MTALYAWFLLGVVTPAIVLAVSCALLRTPLMHVLRDLLGSAARARFFRLVLFAVLATSTLAGSLLSADQLDASASTAEALHLNTAKQLLAAGLALLVGLGAAGCLLLGLISKLEARRV